MFFHAPQYIPYLGWDFPQESSPHNATRCLEESHQDSQDIVTKLGRSVKNWTESFPGGAVVKNPPANAGDTGSSPGPGRSHMPQSN